MPSRSIVLDTNVLVSAALKEGSPPASILLQVLQENIVAITCPAIVEEYLEVFQRPKFRRFQFPPIWLETFLSNAIHLDRNPPLWPLPEPDRDDLVFLSLAFRQNATLITGNLRDYPPAIRRKVEVVDPAGYLSWLASVED
jgi:uncharacterized protein